MIIKILLDEIFNILFKNCVVFLVIIKNSSIYFIVIKIDVRVFISDVVFLSINFEIIDKYMVKKILLNIMIFKISFVFLLLDFFKLIIIFVIIVFDEIVMILVIINVFNKGKFIIYL